MANPENLKPFQKGDSRIWKYGRPKNFDGLKELAQALVHEEVLNKDGKPEVIAGHKATVLEVVLRQWIKSNDFRKQQAALEFAFGRVPQPVEHTGKGGGPIETKANVSIEIARLTTEQIEQLIEIAESAGTETGAGAA